MVSAHYGQQIRDHAWHACCCCMTCKCRHQCATSSLKLSEQPANHPSELPLCQSPYTQQLRSPGHSQRSHSAPPQHAQHQVIIHLAGDLPPATAASTWQTRAGSTSLLCLWLMHAPSLGRPLASKQSVNTEVPTVARACNGTLQVQRMCCGYAHANAHAHAPQVTPHPQHQNRITAHSRPSGAEE
jgi:hypothetical protein